MKHWEHFRHEADVGVRGYGATPAEAFEQAALAMTAAMVDPGEVRARRRVAVHCPGDDLELLLVDWLNALVYETAMRRMLFSRFEVRIDAGGLHAIAWGEPIERGRHQPGVEVKAATFSELVVEPRDDGWCAQCVIDV